MIHKIAQKTADIFVYKMWLIKRRRKFMYMG